MRPDDRMLAGSVGKMFVAVIALQLVEQGRLDLDAPVSRWLGGEPWFARVPNAERLTLRHLLAHRGGVPNHVNDPRFLAAVAQASRDSAALHRAVSPGRSHFFHSRSPAGVRARCRVPLHGHWIPTFGSCDRAKHRRHVLRGGESTHPRPHAARSHDTLRSPRASRSGSWLHGPRQRPPATRETRVWRTSHRESSSRVDRRRFHLERV